MTERILITPGRVSVSRPGYNVLTAPRDSDHMALDSALNIERPIMAGVVFNRSIGATFTINYGVSYATPPAVEVYEWNGASNLTLLQILRYTTGSNTSIYKPYSISCRADGFTLSGPTGVFTDSAMQTQNRHWAYIVWRTS